MSTKTKESGLQFNKVNNDGIHEFKEWQINKYVYITYQFVDFVLEIRTLYNYVLNDSKQMST